jgi:hypothetical protein
MVAPSIEGVLADASSKGITLTLERRDGVQKLIARPSSAVTPEVAATLKENKVSIIATLLGEARRPADGHRREAHRLGLVARWSRDFGFISIHDPTTGEWHDLKAEDAPGWAKREAHKRRELRRAGDPRAHDLTREDMEEIWETEHLGKEEGIIEDHPVEEEG